VFLSKHGIWTPDLVSEIRSNVVAIRRGAVTKEAELFLGLNIITNTGDTYYARRAAAETPSPNFAATTARLRLGSSSAAVAKTDTDVTTFITGASTAVDSGYPKTNNTDDADNTGDGVDIVSWRYQFGTSGFSGSVKEGAIVNAASPTSALNHFLFAAAIAKTNSDTLKVFVNHEALGS